MPDQRSYIELLYQYEILHSRLQIREHFLKTTVEEVYDNIGQMLSFIRVQLSSVLLDFETGKNEKIESSAVLVGEAIRDLRNMCKLFYPESYLFSGTGFNNVVEQEIRMRHPFAVCSFDKVNSSRVLIKQNTGTILFGVLLEIFNLIRDRPNNKLCVATVQYAGNVIDLTLDYKGDVIEIDQMKANSFPVSIFERMEIIGGYMGTQNVGSGFERIKLVTPIN